MSSCASHVPGPQACLTDSPLTCLAQQVLVNPLLAARRSTMAHESRSAGQSRGRQSQCRYAAGSRGTASVPASQAAVAAAAVVALVLLGLLAAPAAAGRAMLQSEASNC